MAELNREDVFGSVEFLDKLLIELDECFPHITPTPADNIAKIMYLAGQRSVVEYIQAKNKDVQ